MSKYFMVFVDNTRVLQFAYNSNHMHTHADCNLYCAALIILTLKFCDLLAKRGRVMVGKYVNVNNNLVVNCDVLTFAGQKYVKCVYYFL